MKTVLKFDRYILTKELNGNFNKIGEVFEIAKVFDDSFLMRDEKATTTIGVVSFEDFKKCFVREEDFKGWTNWVQLIGFDGQNDIVYRTNRKKVQIRFLTDKVRAEAACNKTDDFNLFFGIQLAYFRCLNLALNKKRAKCEEMWKEANCEIIDNERIIKKMINSLEN